MHVTTPGAPQIQALLAQMVANGLQYAVLEMTSHGLAQGRLNGVDLDVAVLTNVTHEHLDYHKTFENYRAAKGRMFEMLSQSLQQAEYASKISMINADDPSADYFIEIVKIRCFGRWKRRWFHNFWPTFRRLETARSIATRQAEPNFMPSMLPDDSEDDHRLILHTAGGRIQRNELRLQRLLSQAAFFQEALLSVIKERLGAV